MHIYVSVCACMRVINLWYVIIYLCMCMHLSVLKNNNCLQQSLHCISSVVEMYSDMRILALTDSLHVYNTD